MAIPTSLDEVLAQLEPTLALALALALTLTLTLTQVLERNYVEKRGHLFYSTPLGRALLAGYVAMGFDLGKPQLRAEMERGTTP